MLVAVLMPIFALMAALAVDIAWMQLARTELRTSTDAASRAGAKELSLEQNIAEARAAALEAAARNPVAGAPLVLDPNDVVFGRSALNERSGKFVFTPGAAPTSGVRVNGRRTADSPSGPVGLLFGRMLNVPNFQPVHTATSTVLDRDICVVIDRSGSMGLDLRTRGDRNGQNCGPLTTDTRFFALVQAVAVFVAELDESLPNEHLALASYSSRFRTRCRNGLLDFQQSDLRVSLTPDYSAVNVEMASFMANGIGGSTAVGEGLREGIRSLANARPFAVKTIVLMTDGLHNTGVSPVRVARDAADANITVNTVSFSRGADQNLMRQVADITGGRHFHADTAADLAAAFQEIARTLPVLLTE
ncbi:von Willebrand factor type A domain protein [Pseudobythopirellula maris]|uniref:von Willebrand factor type A domain protein n=1 Tax=Pseudobythopirellula maris TaxID=2527991 RepID=A0A5C5ZHX4_9BACT|nr:von Willebrand factor type A domain protein [Pseudobythopirellula maris]